MDDCITTVIPIKLAYIIFQHFRFTILPISILEYYSGTWKLIDYEQESVCSKVSSTLALLLPFQEFDL